MISALRAATVSSHDDASQAKSAGQPEEVSNKRLVRAYDWCIEKFADDAEFVSIALFAAAPVALATGTALTTGHPFWMLTIPLSGFWCYCTAMISVISYRDKIKERDDRITEINDSALWRLCESRRQQCDKLMSEKSHLEQDVAHWKAISFAQRGELTVAKGAVTAAGTPVSEKHQDVSAAVVEFLKGAGV